MKIGGKFMGPLAGTHPRSKTNIGWATDHITPIEAMAEREKISGEILAQLESDIPDEDEDRWQ